MSKLKIAIDFDGTCVKHDFPNIGDSIGAEPVLRELVHYGHKLILFTMRSDVTDPNGIDPDIQNTPGKYLSDAVSWFIKRRINLYGIQSDPDQCKWTSSPKCYAHLYIDDAALGIPLIKEPGRRLYVDWPEVRRMLAARGILPEHPTKDCMSYYEFQPVQFNL